MKRSIKDLCQPQSIVHTETIPTGFCQLADIAGITRCAVYAKRLVVFIKRKSAIRLRKIDFLIKWRC